MLIATLTDTAPYRYPVALFLQGLFSNGEAPARGHAPHTLLIDCSRADQAGITYALPTTKVLYGHYHFWKAINGNMDKKVISQLAGFSLCNRITFMRAVLQVGKGAAHSPLRSQRDVARSLIRRMVRSNTEAEFNDAWQQAQSDWSSQSRKWKSFLTYFVTTWHYSSDEWAGYSRRVKPYCCIPRDCPS